MNERNVKTVKLTALVVLVLINILIQQCFAKVSKPKEEDLTPTGKAFQLLGSATAKELKPLSVR